MVDGFCGRRSSQPLVMSLIGGALETVEQQLHNPKITADTSIYLTVTRASRARRRHRRRRAAHTAQFKRERQTAPRARRTTNRSPDDSAAPSELVLGSGLLLLPRACSIHAASSGRREKGQHHNHALAHPARAATPAQARRQRRAQPQQRKHYREQQQQPYFRTAWRARRRKRWSTFPCRGRRAARRCAACGARRRPRGEARGSSTYRGCCRRAAGAWGGRGWEAREIRRRPFRARVSQEGMALNNTARTSRLPQPPQRTTAIDNSVKGRALDALVERRLGCGLLAVDYLDASGPRGRAGCLEAAQPGAWLADARAALDACLEPGARHIVVGARSARPGGRTLCGERGASARTTQLL